MDYAKFTSDGRQVVTHSPDMLHVWDVASGLAPSFQFAGPSSIDQVCFDPKTLRVAAAGYLGTAPPGWACVWDGRSGKRVTSELPHPGRVTRLALSPHGGPFLATACDDSSLRVWKLASEQQTSEATPTAIQQLHFLAFSPDGEWLVVAGADRDARPGVARAYAVSAEGKLTLEKLTVRHDAPVNMVVFSPRGDRFVTLTGDTAADPGRRRSGIGRELAPS